jgi:uncharacterized glyoxalase superfamily protein PhnB
MPRHALIPCLRYKDAPAAIDFLCSAFGFVRHAVYSDETDPAIVFHGELILDGNMIMVGSDRQGGVTDLYNWKTPEAAGCVTMCIYAVIDDPDSHAERARASGARIIRAPYDNQGYPGRSYDVWDSEGNVWNFGNYDPFAA